MGTEASPFTAFFLVMALIAGLTLISLQTIGRRGPIGLALRALLCEAGNVLRIAANIMLDSLAIKPLGIGYFHRSQRWFYFSY